MAENLEGVVCAKCGKPFGGEAFLTSVAGLVHATCLAEYNEVVEEPVTVEPPELVEKPKKRGILKRGK